ncbi:MAG TPA: DUF5694 domain-containing protein [Caulobacteraceae bacterium]|jgi:hypothetical protein
MVLSNRLLCGAAAALLAGALAVGALSASARAPSSPLLIENRPLAARPNLMVLGLVHLGNPDRDLHDAKVDDVLQPKRQREIERVVDALAAWKPTRVAVEWGHKNQAKLDQRYADYRAGKYKLTADETDQIGLRLAAKLGLARVDAVDWNEEPPGTDADYDWEAGAKAAHEDARFTALRDPAVDREHTALVRDHTVASFLRTINSPAYLAYSNRLYYDIALLGGPESNPGANWVGYWHARNLKILDNLIRLDAKPSERILLVIGDGHAYLLNEFAADSHAFRVVRPDAWLARAEDRPRRQP